jgi:hypothetical protein
MCPPLWRGHLDAFSIGDTEDAGQMRNHLRGILLARGASHTFPGTFPRLGHPNLETAGKQHGKTFIDEQQHPRPGARAAFAP